ncbi:MAG: glycosyltransferase family 2 protein [Planctomycetes bacterium]|nr:glycosyltransferase family 2 protein [Planctomycetota bacterium]
MPQPQVSLMISAVGDSRNLACAIRGALGQLYENIEIIVVADRPAADELKAGAERLKVLPVDSKTSVPAAYNAAIKSAKGELIAYGDADTIFYPNHVAALAGAISAKPDCQAACGDLYRTHYQRTASTRHVRAKILSDELSPGRFGLCYANYVPLAGLCHRRELLENTGPFNESLARLFDWDMARRISFFSRIEHLETITGEILTDVNEVRQPAGGQEYLAEMLAVKTTRPPKPWPMMPDLSIIFIAPSMTPAACKALRQIWVWTYVPFEVYLPVSRDEHGSFAADLGNLIVLPMAPANPPPARVDEAIAACKGDYVALVPHDMPIGPLWLENAYNAIVECNQAGAAYMLGDSVSHPAAAVYRREELAKARLANPAMTIRQSIQQAGIELRKSDSAGPAWHCEQLIAEARACEREGDWTRAGEIYEEALRESPCIHLKTLAAGAFCNANIRMERALHLIKDVNARRPCAQSLFLEAKITRGIMGPGHALALLTRAEEELTWKG